MNIFFCGGGGHHNIGLYLGAISMHLGSFLRSMYRMGNTFLVAKIQNLFIYLFFFFWGGGCLKSLIFFLGWGGGWGDER